MKKSALILSAAAILAGSALTGWAAPAKAAVKKTVPGFLNAVSCVANARYCMAVGSQGTNDSAGLSEQWDGSTWTVVPTPALDGSNVVLSGVACTAENNCLAVGSYFNDGNTVLAETWNGSAWTIQAVPLPSGTFKGGSFGDLDAVSCSSSGSCMAVGDYDNSGNSPTALSEYWDGAAFDPEPVSIADASTNTLATVSCGPAPTSDCDALGWYFASGGSEVSLVAAESWNGSSWTQQSVPQPIGPGAEDYPSGISCLSAAACTAVGFGFNGSSPEAAWALGDVNGRWSNETVATPAGSTFTSLQAISCGSNATSCQAVGTDSSGTLGETWNGSVWKDKKTADPKGTSGDDLAGVSCAPSGDPCEAVGYDTDSSGVQVPLVEVWKGSKWSTQTTPKL